MSTREERPMAAEMQSGGTPFGSFLDAVAYAAIALLRTQDVQATIPDVLRTLGEAAGVSRIYVYQNVTVDGELADIERFEWAAPGIHRTIDEGIGSAPYLPDFEHYIRAMGTGGIIAELTKDAPPADRASLEGDGVLAVALVPIFVRDAWWGYIGFDDCWSEREWVKEELSALRVAAETIGAALERQDLDASLVEIEHRYRTFIEQAPDIVIYSDLPGEGDTTTYVSPQIEDIFGVTPERWIEAEGDTLWLAMIHPEDRQRVQRQFDAYLGGGPDVEDYRIVREDGRIVWIRDRATMVREPDGRLVEWGVYMDVTHLRGVEDRLVETERQHRTLIEQLPAIFYTEDARNRVLYVSPQSEEVLGVAAEQWLADPDLWRKLLVPEDRERVIADAAHHRDLKDKYADEYRLQKSDGTIVWIRDEAAPIFGDDGNFMLWQGLMLDVSEQKRAEELARETETKFRTLVENSPAVIYIDTPDGLNLPLYISPQVEQMVGYTPEEWMQDPNMWSNLLHPDDRERELRVVAEADATGEPYEAEYRMITRDGRTIWVHEAAELIRNEAGEPVNWQGVLVDVTERKTTEARLREAEERFKVLVESSSAITTIVSAEGDVLHVSPQIEDVYGYAPEEFIRNIELWEQVLHPDDRERIMALDRLTDETGDQLVAEYRVVTASGETKWIHEESNFVPHIGGSGGNWLGVQLDITESKRAQELERDLSVEKATTAKLRELDEMKDQILAGVSHDLRTPLSSILGFAMTLDEQSAELSPEQRQDFAHRIRLNALKQQALVNDLLDLHRLKQGVSMLALFPIDIGSLVAEVAEQADYLQNHALVVETESVVVSADEIKIKRMVENLLTNAARYTPPGTQVWVRVSAQPDGALISIEDAGPGIPSEEKEHLFDEFTMGAKSRESGSPGLGVGLSLVARFAQMHGGRAWMEDRPGGGSVFLISLPKQPPT